MILEILTTQQYRIVTLYVSYTLSYGLWIVTLGLLARAFFSWYRLSNRNIMVLILALAMIAYVINGITGLAYHFDMLTQQKAVITSTDIASFPEFSIATLGSQIDIVYQISAGVAYIFTWVGTVKLLYPYIMKLGKVKFWTIMGVAMAYYLIEFPLFVLGYFTTSENVDAMTNIIIFSLAGIFTGVVFGASIFVSSKNSAKREHSQKPYDIGRLWVSSLLYRRLSHCRAGGLSSIWTCFSIPYGVIVLFDIFRALFFSSYSIPRHSIAHLN